MRCEDVKALASDYIDGHLDDARGSALRGHLRQCENCLAAVQGLAAVRDAARELAPVDPPPALWAAVEQGLAEAEIADAQRPRAWLYWQALRPKLLPAAVVAAAAATALIWIARHAPELSDGKRPAEVAQPAASVPAPAAASAVGLGESFAAQRERELASADQRYLDTLDELRALVAADRAGWSAQSAAAFDRALAAVRAAHADGIAARTGSGAGASARPEGAAPEVWAVRTRDRRYAGYRAEIALLQAVAVGGEAALDDLADRPSASAWAMGGPNQERWQ